MEIEECISLVETLSGVSVSYYYTCLTQFWLYGRGISVANSTETDDILIGRYLHRTRYKKMAKEVSLFRNKMDVINFKKGVVVIERKKGKITKGGIMQLKYYLFVLKIKGIPNPKGILSVPGKRVYVSLSKKDEEMLCEDIKKMIHILKSRYPPSPKKKKLCNKCAFKEFCFSGWDE